jgi:hypothetical protein
MLDYLMRGMTFCITLDVLKGPERLSRCICYGMDDRRIVFRFPAGVKLRILVCFKALEFTYS